MTYTFLDISTVKFSINSRELYKTFIPFYVDANHIKIINIYDSQMVLVPTTHVSEFEVDGFTYANANDLSNAIHTVIYSRTVDGAVNNAQIETNRLAIIDLQNDKSDVGHNHDARYYTQAQVDAMITAIVSASDLLAKGEVDGDSVNFRKADDTLVFSIDANTFTRQGTSVSFTNGVLTLKNDKGETLSTTNVEAKEAYYDKFKFVSGIEDDLSDLVLTDPFELVKTTGDLYFFASDKNNVEKFDGKRIFINTLDQFFDLANPDIDTAPFSAWQLTIPAESFIDAELYAFNKWIHVDEDYLTASDLYPIDRILDSSYEWNGGYNYTVIYVEFAKNGDRHLKFFNQLETMDAADPIDDRLDQLVFNMESETVYKKTGTPALATLLENEYLITIIPVGAGTTEPVGVTEETVYEENLQEVGGEYDTAVSDPSIDPDSTDNPITDAKSIKFDLSGNGDYIDLSHSVAKTQSDYSHLKLKILLTNAISHNIRLSLRDAAGNFLGTHVGIKVGYYGFDDSNTITVQSIIIPISNFDATLGLEFYRLRIENRQNNASYYIDDIKFVSGLGTSVNLDDFLPRGGYPGTAQDLKNEIDAIGATPGIISVTGPTVDNTDPDNPIVNLPSATEVRDLYETARTVISQAEAEAGTETTVRLFNALRVKQAIDARIAEIIDGSPGTLDTLNEIAAALGDDPNFAATMTAALAGKQPLDATLTALAGLVGSADKLPYFTGDDTLSLADLTAYGRTLIALADAAALRANINVENGADVTDAVNVGSSMTGAAAKTTPVDADTIPLSDSADSNLLKKVTWANIKATLKTYFDTVYVLISDFLEEKIFGTATYNATVTGAVNIDLSAAACSRLILTGNSTITFTNTPASGKSVVRTYLISSTAAETLGFANSTNEYGEYVNDTSINKVVVEASNYPTAGLIIDVQFNVAN